MGNDEFKLGDNDCAIIIKDDMTMEMFIPERAPNDNVSFEDDQHIFITMAIALSMEDPEFRRLISAKIEQITSHCGVGCGGGGCGHPTNSGIDCGPGCCGC